MLPTPDTSHVPYSRVYEPAEDSFLLLDTLSSPSETAFLSSRFTTTTSTTKSPPPPPPPLVVEIGPGSGVVIGFLTAHAQTIFSTREVLACAVDVNRFACAATVTTAAKAVAENAGTAGLFLDAVQGDLGAALRRGVVDVLVFNPPYVPTEELPVPVPPPVPVSAVNVVVDQEGRKKTETTWEDDSHLLALSYAGGKDGMETTDRLLDALPGMLSVRGCAYVLLCAQNWPEKVKERMRRLGAAWRAETVGTSGKQAGWEKLQIVRIWRDIAVAPPAS
ncbi:hypothetical protein B0H63DRAFT_32446 [Podospora didyma]|uniref:ERF1 methyltransferase catalytic subunit MTQ2 n=1 Tax=Podospora didyma TaxID=330526 RepID=A0AAE0P644_9PEZI|nr:hypothetical protein B0H63DRAFT_32446 [Podospora didyma]